MYYHHFFPWFYNIYLFICMLINGESGGSNSPLALHVKLMESNSMVTIHVKHITNIRCVIVLVEGGRNYHTVVFWEKQP